MHYIPETPWYDPLPMELELQVAAGRLQRANPPDLSDPTLFPLMRLLALVLGIQMALGSLIVWLALRGLSLLAG